MQYEVLRGLCVVLLWVGLWGIMEMAIDKISGNSLTKRLVVYIIAVALALFIIWLTTLAI